MLQAIPCPKCQGLGCKYCNSIGAIGRDENNDYYLEKSGGRYRVAGIISNQSGTNPLENILGLFFKLISRSLEEPHDYLWSIKKRK